MPLIDDKHFDKVLLFTLLIALVVIWEIILFKAFNTSWIENISGQVLAALLTLMVGSRAVQRQSDTPGGGVSNNPEPVVDKTEEK